MSLFPVALVASLAGAALALAGGDESKPVWVQAAKSGTFKGHARGKFTLDAKVFSQLTTNLRNHPSFHAGADGVGDRDVIPVDFHHANEASPGQIAATGAPAQGWVQDLQQRTGSDGPELWARIRYLEPARSYVLDQKYKWLSVAIWPNTKQPVTGENIGWYMSSIALTNDPFIQGMKSVQDAEKIAASRGGFIATPLVATRPQTRAEVLDIVKELLGDDAASGLAELRRTAADPNDVEAAVTVGALRQVLNLPTLAKMSQIFTETEQLLAAAPQMPAHQEPLQRGPIDMSLTLKLAARLGISNDVITAGRADNAAGIARLDFELERAVETVLLERNAAKETVDAIYKKTGTTESVSTLARVDVLLARDKELTELGPKVAELQAANAKAQEQGIADDVNDAIKTHRLEPRSAPSLVLHRKTDPTGFATLYPRLPEGLKHLTQNVTGAPKGARVTLGPGGAVSFSRDAPGANESRLATEDRTVDGREPAIDLSAYEGRNELEKMMAFVRSKNPKITLEECHANASELLKGLRLGQNRQLAAG